MASSAARLLVTAAAAAVATIAAAPHATAAPWTPSPVPVFVAGSEGVPQYRIPALVQTGTGTLLAFAEARYAPATDCGYKTLVVRRSADGGDTWSPSVVVAGARADNGTATGNPMAVYHAPTGRVVVVFGVQRLPPPRTGCSPADGVFVVDDGGSDGAAWGTPVNITASLGPVAGHAIPGPGAGLVLTAASGPRAGRIVMSGTAGAYGSDAAFFSDDGGRTWAASATAIPRMDESALVELPDGTVLLNMRNDHANASCDCRAVAASADGGATFATPVVYDATLISPVCQASLLRVGDRVYFANPADRSARANITVRVGSGRPGGWTGALRVLAGAAWGGYTSMAGPLARGGGDADASGGIVYEHWDDAGGGATISFTAFPLLF